MTLTRRTFQRQLQAGALALALAPWQRALTQPADQARTWKNNPFSLGVASGRPRPDAIMLWTRLLVSDEDRRLSAHTDEGLKVEWEVFADEALRRPLFKGQQVTDGTRGHSVHVHLQGLAPARDYWYRFRCGDALSRVGHTRTAPAADAAVKQLRIALASCQHFEQGHYIAHRDIAEQPLDFVLFVGDYIYESSNPRYAIRQHTGGEPMTLPAYRDRYALYKSDPLLQASHAAHPWVLMWDDHEVVNDYANDADRNYTDPQQFLLRRAAAYQAYFEHQPVLLGPDKNNPADMRLYEQLTWGKLADVWTLDCRQYRSPQACRDPVRGVGRMVMQCDELNEISRTMLGAAQERWITDSLSQSKRQWKLVAQATQISPTNVPAPVGRSYWNDAWDGYPEARKRLLQTVVDAKLSNVVTLGGDVHCNVAANLRLEPNNPQSPIVASEFVTTSITSRGLGDKAATLIRENNADLLHYRSDERGYSLITVTPKQVRCDFRTTKFPAGSEAGLKTQATYVVKSGKAGPQVI